MATGEEQRPRQQTSRRLRAPALGVVFGVIGMLTGLGGLYIAWDTKTEQSTVILAAYPSASAADLTHEGLGIRLELVNQSLRPVIIRNASLWRGKDKVGDATGYVADVAVLDRATTDPAAVTRARLRLPITIDARAGRTLGLLVDVWRPIVATSSSEAQRAARRSLNELLLAIGDRPDQRTDPIRLRLDRVPGGSQWFDVRPAVVASVYPEAIRDANAAATTAQAGGQLWIVGRAVSGRALRALTIRRTLAAPDQADLVRLTIWRQGFPGSWTAVRPSIGQQSTAFPLPRQERGAYVAVFEAGGRVVAHTTYALPLVSRCAREVPPVEASPTWCGP